MDECTADEERLALIREASVARDEISAARFVHLMCGFKVTGLAGERPVMLPHSRELREHLIGALGECTPNASDDMTDEQAVALASYLRSVADLMDPEGRPGAAD
jgi:hypothetical protein